MTIKETIQSAAQSVLTYVHDNMPEGAIFEDTVLASSANGVKSSGIYTALQTKADASTVSDLSTTVSGISTNVGTIQGQITSIQTTLDNKQDELTFDSTPTADSTNPVTSEGIKTYVDNNVPSIIQGDGINVTVSGTDTTIACDYGAVEAANTTKPVTGAAVKTAIDDATPNITAGAGIDITNNVISAVLPTSDPGVDNVLYIL